MIIPEGELEQAYPQVYLTSEDGEYFNISFSEGTSAYEIVDLTEEDIDSMIQDIKNQVELFRLYFQSSTPTTKMEE